MHTKRTRAPHTTPDAVNRLLELAAGADDIGVTAAADSLLQARLAHIAAQSALTDATTRVGDHHAAGALWDSAPMATAMARRATAAASVVAAAAVKHTAVAALRSALTRVALTTTTTG